MVYPSDDDGNDESEETGEEADEVVPDGVEEVELAKIKLEERERETKVLIDDIRALLSRAADTSAHVPPALQPDDNISWVVTGSTTLLVRFCMNFVLVRPCRYVSVPTTCRSLIFLIIVTNFVFIVLQNLVWDALPVPKICFCDFL